MGITFSIGRVGFAFGVDKTLNTVGVGATLEFMRSPTELHFDVQPGLPFTLYFTVGKV